MKRYNVVGWYGRRNCGDDALQLAMSKVVGGDLTFSTRPTKGDDPIILGGGDVIYPLYLGHIRKTGKRIKVLGAGIGYEEQATFLKGIADEVWLRNREDVELARLAGVDAHYTPDLAFSLEVGSAPDLPVSKKKHLGVMVADTINVTGSHRDARHHSYADYFSWELAEGLRYLSEWYEIHFVPMSHYQYAYDIKMIYDIVNRLPGCSPNVLPEPLSPLDTLALVSKFDLLVTMRFHGLIFATIAHTPFVNIGLSRKTALFCREHGLSDLSLDPYSFEYTRFQEFVKNAEQDGVRERLQVVHEEKKTQLAEVKKHIQECW